MKSRLPLSFALFLGLGALVAQAAYTENATGVTMDRTNSSGNLTGAADVLEVTMDNAKIVRIPAGTATLVIGNPIVADVTRLKGSSAMGVTGKGFGETNLIAVDAQGNVLGEKTVVVTPSRGAVVVQRGLSRESYSCRPLCMPTVQLGDDPKSFGASSGQITTYNGLSLAGNEGPKPQQ